MLLTHDADAADIIVLAGPGAGSPTVTGSAPGLVTPGRDGPGPRDRATVAALLTVALPLSH